MHSVDRIAELFSDTPEEILIYDEKLNRNDKPSGKDPKKITSDNENTWYNKYDRYWTFIISNLFR